MKVATVVGAVGVVALAAVGEVASAQDRLRRSIDGPVTREAVTRSLAVVPANAGDEDGPAEVSVMLRIGFGFDSAELTGQARRDLDSVAAALNGPELAGARLTLEGHTDATGGAEYNLRLSQRRAEAVVTYLVEQGVSGGRLRPAGFGEERLLSAYGPDRRPAAAGGARAKVLIDDVGRCRLHVSGGGVCDPRSAEP